MIELRYQTSADDYLALLNHVLERSVLGRRFARFAWVMISLLAWLSVALPYLKLRDTGPGFWWRTALAFVVTVGFPVFYRSYSTRCFASIINSQTCVGLAGLAVLTANDEFAQVAGPKTTLRAKWRDIHEIVVTHTHLFLFFAPLVAAPIPRGALAGDEQFRALHAGLRELWNAGRAGA